MLQCVIARVANTQAQATSVVQKDGRTSRPCWIRSPTEGPLVAFGGSVVGEACGPPGAGHPGGHIRDQAQTPQILLMVAEGTAPTDWHGGGGCRFICPIRLFAPPLHAGSVFMTDRFGRPRQVNRGQVHLDSGADRFEPRR